MRFPAHLLRVDSLAGLSVGFGVLVLSAWLSDLYAVPHSYVLVNAAANLVYGSYSGWLSRRAQRPMALIVALVTANALWALFCLLAMVWLADRASIFGLGTLAFEALFVGGLAALEWRHRHVLATDSPLPDTRAAASSV